MIPTTGVFDNGPLGFTATISTNQQEMNLATWATGQGWDGSSYAEITIAAGVYVWSDDTSVPAMTTGNFPNGLKLIVDGYVIGKGGAGSWETDQASNGGPALLLGCDVTILGGANGFIAGGGGGGGGSLTTNRTMGGGGGAGGGKGGDFSSEPLGGAGGSVGQPGDDGADSSEDAGLTGDGGGGGGSGGGGAAN